MLDFKKTFKGFAFFVLFFNVTLSIVNAQTIIEGDRPPASPYHGWYQPGSIGNPLADYSNMNLGLCGTVNPQWIHNNNDGESLMWSYGTNAPSYYTSSYFSDLADPGYLTVSNPDGTYFQRSGFAMDEWLGRDSDEMRNKAVDGLRAARANYPDVFIAAWFTDTSPQLIQLAKEGTIDLLIYEGYQIQGKMPEHGISDSRTRSESWYESGWKSEAASDLAPLKNTSLDSDPSKNLLNKTIYCHGYINGKYPAYADTANPIEEFFGQEDEEVYMTPEYLEQAVIYVKNQYPEMPGVAFYQANGYTDPATIALINKANELSQTYYPVVKPPINLSDYMVNASCEDAMVSPTEFGAGSGWVGESMTVYDPASPTGWHKSTDYAYTMTQTLGLVDAPYGDQFMMLQSANSAGAAAYQVPLLDLVDGETYVLEFMVRNGEFFNTTTDPAGNLTVTIGGITVAYIPASALTEDWQTISVQYTHAGPTLEAGTWLFQYYLQGAGNNVVFIDTVPEPASLLTLMAGVCGMMFRKRTCRAG